MQRLTAVLDGESPFDTLLALAEKGLVCADSFLPVRQWLRKDSVQKETIKQRISVRAKAMTTGRWEICRPRLAINPEQQLERAFDQAILLCRETTQGISWSNALELLRVWEYTGRVRRGYFIEGLSGIQFIREKDYVGTLLAFEQPDTEIIWLSASDPAQPWGKCLPHLKDRSFLNVAGTVVALRGGVPLAVFERQGRTLRSFEDQPFSEVIHAFVQDFTKKRIFPSLNRIVVKEYPVEAVTALTENGFKHELQDYVLYR